MRNIILSDQKGFKYKRISKAQARRAYNNGLTILWIPVNLRPFTGWAIEMPVNIMDISSNFAPFDSVLNMFESYNCNAETGRYTAFYMPFKTVDRFTGDAPTSETIGTIDGYDYDYLSSPEKERLKEVN